ncbi:Oar protein [Acidisarcina polymorpha]|uniref:Oar protein n=1 Tax=Acidisarcina polymorpha TaxID=2211140 RepID=A0A2Z5FS43_9BACT|nr:Oar protein [Acidisarcina polymorpha]
MTATGFQNETSEVSLAGETPRNLDIKLQVGPASQTVTVSANDVSVLNTSNANIGTSLSSADVNRLPIVGRDPYELLRLTPGTVSDAARSGSGSSVSLPNNQSGNQSNSGIFQTENQIQASASGQRVTSNTYLIDGVSVDSLSHGGSAVVTPNPESVAEITTTSSSFDAGDGYKVGLHTRVVSKAGSNDLHGSLFFQYDEPGLNAFQPYGGPSGALPVRVENKQREWAGSIGFPILKNKLFLFSSYEGISNINSGFSEQYVPTPQYLSGLAALRGGGIVSGVLTGPGSAPQVVSVLPISCQNLQAVCTPVGTGADIGSFAGGLGTYLPAYNAATPALANNASGGGLDGIPDVEFAQVRTTSRYRGNQWNGRVDWNLTPSDQLAASVYFVKLSQSSPDASTGAQPLSDLPFKPFNSSGTVVYIHTFNPKLVNEARANYSRYEDNQISDAGTTVDFGIPRFEVQGYTFGRFYDGPIWGSTTPAILAQNTYEFRDQLIQTFGSHTLRYGGLIRWEQDNDNLSGFSRPDYVFQGIWNYANDAPIDESIAANPNSGGPAIGQRYFRDHNLAGFIQHDWKITPNFTLNTGLRWEYFEPLYNKGSRINEPIFGPTYATFLSAAVLAPVNHIFNSNYNNWGPKFGFAWSPEKANNKLVVSGGFGMSYDRLDDGLYLNGFENGPGYAQFGLCCASDTQTPAATHIVFARGATRSAFSYPVNPYLSVGTDPTTGLPNGAGAIEVYGASPHTAQPMIYSFASQIQYELPYQIVATVGYQGTVGHHFPRLVDQNFLYPTCAPTNPDGSCATGSVLSPFNNTYIPTTDVATNYNALNLQLNKRFSHGYNITAFYTYSKSLDQSSNEGPGSLSNQTDPANPVSEYGPSDFDVRHRVTVAGNWDLPKYHNGHGLVGNLVSGWQINGIYQFHTGFPWTPVTGQPTVAVVQSASTLAPTRPLAYFGGAGNSCSNGAYINGTNFPGGGQKYFLIGQSGPPGIGRNSWNGPCYMDTDLSAAKEQIFSVLGHESHFRFQANAYNVFNKTNLQPISAGTNEALIENSLFGVSPGADSGRVIEFFARIDF